MKKIAVLLVGVGLLLGCLGGYALAGDKDAKAQAVKKRLQEMFELSKQEQWAKLCAYVAYAGDDEKRAYKDVANPADPNELGAVTSIGMQIQGFLQAADSVAFTKFGTEKESEGEWAFWFVEFKKGDKAIKKIFAFLPIKGQYLLGDID